MIHKLDITGEAKIEYFLSKYSELNSSLKLIEKDMETLQERKDAILEEFKFVRKQDEEFKASLVEKFGEGEILPAEYAFETKL